MPNSIDPGLNPAYVGVTQDQSGKKIANWSVQMWIDNQDGNGPQLQTVYFQAVNVTELDEFGNAIAADDRVEYEWKRQMLDELRAIRIGIEHILETGPPSLNLTVSSLIDEARAQRLNDSLERIEQEN